MGSPANAAQALAQAQQQNALARQIIQSQGVEMTTSIFSTTVNPASNPVVNIPVRNVGLIKGFIIEVVATVHNTTAAAAITPTDFGPANILSQITFTDLNNNNRVQTTGWHLEFINTVKSKRIFGSAAPFTTGNDSPINYGSNWQVINSAPSIAAAANGTLTMKYWLPIAYSDTDYRGAIWANVINATMQLQVTINANCVAASGGDTTNACYVGAAATGSCTSATVTVYQVFMDQVPQSGGAPILPALDLSTVYELKNTNFASITPNNEFPLQYSNFRQYLSTITVFYNGTARATGADVIYWSLQSANYTNIWKKDPSLIAMQTRNIIGADMPPGVYYFSSRGRPISTNQYGNMQLILNASTAGPTAYINVGYEDFALVNTIQQAGSLAAS